MSETTDQASQNKNTNKFTEPVWFDLEFRLNFIRKQFTPNILLLSSDFSFYLVYIFNKHLRLTDNYNRIVHIGYKRCL